MDLVQPQYDCFVGVMNLVQLPSNCGLDLWFGG